MNKWKERFFGATPVARSERRFALTMVTLISIACFALVMQVTMPLRADSAPESILPQFARMRSSQDVYVVNLQPFRVARNISGSDQQGLWLSYGQKCHMREGATLLAIGQDGDRVLVRSRQEDPGHLPLEGTPGMEPYCTEETLFWMHIQQYRLAAQEHRQAQAKRQREETDQERDKRVIRQLLDEQLVKK